MAQQAAPPLHGPPPNLPAPASGRVHLDATRLLDAPGYAALADLFRALADPTRVQIVHMLVEQSRCVCDLARAIGVSEPTISQHLRRLRSLQMVHGQRRGKMVYYQLQDARVQALLTLALHHEHAVPASGEVSA